MAEKKKIRTTFEVEASPNEALLARAQEIFANLTAEERAKILADAIMEKVVAEEEAKPAEEFTETKIEGDGAKTPALRFKIKRNQKELIDIVKTPLWKLEEMFINEQTARGNSSYTQAYYKRCFKKLYQAVAFMYEEGNKNFIEDLYNNAPDDLDPLAWAGMNFPIAIMQDLDLQLNFVEYLRDVEEVNEQTVNSYLRGLKAIFKYCVSSGWVEDRTFTINEKEPPIKQVYSDAELKKLLRKPSLASDNFATYRNWVVVNHCLATGNRVNTIINIKVGDVDLDAGFLLVQVQKSGKTNRIPLPKKYIKILREYILYCHTNEDGSVNVNDYLFCNEAGEKISAEGLKKAIAEYNRRRGVEKTSMHLFRHTFAKEWIVSGGDVASLQKILGHNTIAMAQRYANLFAEDIKPKVEQHAAITKYKGRGGKRKTINIK